MVHALHKVCTRTVRKCREATVTAALLALQILSDIFTQLTTGRTRLFLVIVVFGNIVSSKAAGDTYELVVAKSRYMIEK